MYELDVNEENIKKTIATDVLGRNGSIFNFLKLIYSINTKSTISIDGNWGTGKTFFVKQTELIMNLLNDPKVNELEPAVQSVKDKRLIHMEILVQYIIMRVNMIILMSLY